MKLLDNLCLSWFNLQTIASTHYLHWRDAKLITPNVIIKKKSHNYWKKGDSQHIQSSWSFGLEMRWDILYVNATSNDLRICLCVCVCVFITSQVCFLFILIEHFLHVGSNPNLRGHGSVSESEGPIYQVLLLYNSSVLFLTVFAFCPLFPPHAMVLLGGKKSMLLFSIQQTLNVFLFLRSGEHQDQLTLVGTLLGKPLLSPRAFGRVGRLIDSSCSLRHLHFSCQKSDQIMIIQGRESHSSCSHQNLIVNLQEQYFYGCFYAFNRL